MELKLGPEIIGSYKRLAYKQWYALAEFIDNSTQAFFNNREILEKVYSKNNENLTIKIDYGVDDEGEFLTIKDNSIGMSLAELKDAVIVGRPPQDTSWRSKYGLGLKTAACWFGDFWTVVTKKLGDDTEHYIEVSVSQITLQNLNLNHKENKAVDINAHYTIITIRQLHRKFHGLTVRKNKDYLRSIYRLDINEYGLKIFWKDELLEWDMKEQIDDRQLKDKSGKLVKRGFEFLIGEKKVRGWAGVFERGSRAIAGFSIIQANRVIKGWPSSYRPQLLFGSQEGGRNDLINQRLVGELYFKNFDVSHTKDEILFSDDEEQELDNKLFKEFADLRSLALSYRKYQADERSVSEVHTDAALSEFEEELSSDEIVDSIFVKKVPSQKLIKETNRIVKETVMEKIDPSVKVIINDLTVYLYVVSDMSPNDPYVIIESTEKKDRVIVIVNKAHPYWLQLKSQESIMNFLRHCTYDGVAEWKACFKVGNLDPDTIKLIKDDLLRLPMEIEKHAAMI